MSSRNGMSSNDHRDRIVATLYKFVHLPDYREIQPGLLNRCRQLNLRGTVLLAEEGINGTVAGSREAIDLFFDYLCGDERFLRLEYKESAASDYPFHRIKVKLRKEIVTMGVVNIDPSRISGKRIGVDEWNRVVSDPETLVLDVRNCYECGIGTFRNAISSGIDHFRQFPEYVQRALNPARHKSVAMFCTGGIRCEKASAFMLMQGFEQVYQLHGGILRYLKEVQAQDSLWQGECFVFDSRVSVDGRLQQGGYEQCFACRRPVTREDRRSQYYQQGVSCPGCYDDLTGEQRARFRERQKQVELAERRGEKHIGNCL